MISDQGVDVPAPKWGQRIPHCPWIKITQLLGVMSCYLLPRHDGDHCSAEWMEWT